MRALQTRDFDLVRTTLGLLLVPALWPLCFIGVAIFFPSAIDPLLGGLQAVLYFPAFLWLLTILGATLGAAKIFRLRRTNVLFLVTGVTCALTVSLALGFLRAWGDHQLIGQPGVIYPNHFDVEYQTRKIAALAAFSTVVTVATACAFVSIGAFRLFKRKEI